MLRTLIAAFALTTSLCAANHRALLLGVSKYKSPIPSLPGIDKDIANMKRVAQLMGFQPDQIRILFDDQVTVAAIKREFGAWLSQAGPNDRVLIYFTGHGAEVKDVSGDEESGRDQIWVTSESNIVNGEVRDYMLDDDVDVLLRGLHSQNVLLVLDSCHSGSADRAVGTVIKEAGFPGAPRGVELAKRRAAAKATPAPPTRHVLLSACQDKETAGASGKGSYLTSSLAAAVSQLSAAKRPLKLTEIQAEVERGVLSGKPDQHPRLSGDPALLSADWFFSGTQQSVVPPPPPPPPPPTLVPDPGPTPARAKLEDLLSKSTSRFNCQMSDGSRLKAGRTVKFSCLLPFSGYLNVVNIGDGDPQAITLFPNNWAQNNQVAAGAITLPDANRVFEVEAGLPGGMTTQRVGLYFFLSPTQKSLFEVAPTKDFAAFDDTAARSLTAVGPRGYAGAKVEFVIAK